MFFVMCVGGDLIYISDVEVDCEWSCVVMIVLMEMI